MSPFMPSVTVTETYLFRLDNLCSLNVDQLAHRFLYGVELAAVTRRVKAVCVCLKEDREENKSSSKSEIWR